MQLEHEPTPEEVRKVSVNVPNHDMIQHWFTYHKPTEADIPKYLAVREAALGFARVIHDLCPDGADKSTAIRKVREAVMTANASIACCGK